MHFVTTLEEMPVQETLDGIDEVSRIGLPVGTVIVNMEREPLLTAADLAGAAAGRSGRGPRLGVADEGGNRCRRQRCWPAWPTEAAEHADRVELERTERGPARTAPARRMVTLPFLTRRASTSARLYDFADHLREGGQA